MGLKKQINGLLNRLSDQSKDSILRSLKALFDGNSTMVICKLLYDSVMASLENAAGILTAIIPVTAVLVAALTILVSRDISSYLLEELTKKFESSFIKCLSGDDSNFKFSQERERSSYHLASNCCLLLGYLYNYKVVGHTLLMDILRSLAEGSWPGNRLYKNLVTNIDDSLHLEGDIDMINLIMKHCQQNFFSDDPLFLKLVITKLSHRIDVFNKINIDKTRIHFLYDSLVALSLGKSKSVINPITDQIRQHRKWLGSVKSLMSNSRSKEICLSVSLSDLLDADENGRWWRSGAMWNGRSTTESISNEKKSNISIKDTVELISNEEKELNLLAKQLRMNTTTRKSIFVVLMSSQDVTDAFERLMRLNLKGKSDRDIAVVMLECCIQESQYNPFYAELGKLLCSANRQFKTTFTFLFWDFFKLLAAEDAKMEKRKILNSARLLSDLVATFSIPLSVIKSLEVSDLNDSLVLYLSTFFMALFTSEVH